MAEYIWVSYGSTDKDREIAEMQQAYFDSKGYPGSWVDFKNGRWVILSYEKNPRPMGESTREEPKITVAEYEGPKKIGEISMTKPEWLASTGMATKARAEGKLIITPARAYEYGLISQRERDYLQRTDQYVQTNQSDIDRAKQAKAQFGAQFPMSSISPGVTPAQALRRRKLEIAETSLTGKIFYHTRAAGLGGVSDIITLGAGYISGADKSAEVAQQRRAYLYESIVEPEEYWQITSGDPRTTITIPTWAGPVYTKTIVEGGAAAGVLVAGATVPAIGTLIGGAVVGAEVGELALRPSPYQAARTALVALPMAAAPAAKATFTIGRSLVRAVDVVEAKMPEPPTWGMAKVARGRAAAKELAGFKELMVSKEDPTLWFRDIARTWNVERAGQSARYDYPKLIKARTKMTGEEVKTYERLYRYQYKKPMSELTAEWLGKSRETWIMNPKTGTITYEKRLFSEIGVTTTEVVPSPVIKSRFGMTKRVSFGYPAAEITAARLGIGEMRPLPGAGPRVVKTASEILKETDRKLEGHRETVSRGGTVQLQVAKTKGAVAQERLTSRDVLLGQREIVRVGERLGTRTAMRTAMGSRTGLALGLSRLAGTARAQLLGRRTAVATVSARALGFRQAPVSLLKPRGAQEIIQPAAERMAFRELARPATIAGLGAIGMIGGKRAGLGLAGPPAGTGRLIGRRRPIGTRTYKYAPSLAGIVSGRTLAKAPIGKLTGLEIRYPVRGRRKII